MYHGHALKDSKTIVFNSGAAGYVLSRATMKQLVAQWHDHNPTCTADQAPQWLQDNPGLVTTQCLKDVLGIVPVDTRASASASVTATTAASTALTKTHPTQHKNKKYHRFHAFPLTRTVSGKVDQWYINKHQVGTPDFVLWYNSVVMFLRKRENKIVPFQIQQFKSYYRSILYLFVVVVFA